MAWNLPRINPVGKILGKKVAKDRYGQNIEAADNPFEQEKHADDDIHCLGCGKKLKWTGGWSDYCSACRKGNWHDPDCPGCSKCDSYED